MSKLANTTLLTLIPKNKVSSSVTDFRPISCCTIFYKTINGSIHGFFKGESGLRQGDALSPYLFVLSMEILSTHLREIGDLPSVMAAVDILHEFDKCSGLHANINKTDIYLWGRSFPFRYLGLPLNTLKNSTKIYGTLISKIQHSLQVRENIFLTYAGRLQILNTIIFGITNFWCASVLLPKTIIKLINKLCKDYFWHVEQGVIKMMFKSWKAVCSPRHERGFNIKELISWNRALLAKWIWVLDNQQTGLWAVWTKSYLFPNESIWTVQPKDYHSDSFCRILKVRDELLQITGAQAPGAVTLNSWIRKGKFQVQLYEWFRMKNPMHLPSQSLVNRAIIPAHQVIAMIAIQKKLATIDPISGRGLIIINHCCLCEEQSESHKHLFFHCQFSRIVWQYLLEWMKLSGRSFDYWTELCWLNRRSRKKHWKCSWAKCCIAAVYYIWQERNYRIFSGRRRTVQHVLH
ncbi:uncharacterized protein LOC141620172 [Silene latifolia]|uniref:uncharacterized protein LOC141620172 n=1 Tax=Silene latifolia TaxID=37657 RepID=UPI003D77A6DE